MKKLLCAVLFAFSFNALAADPAPAGDAKPADKTAKKGAKKDEKKDAAKTDDAAKKDDAAAAPAKK
ncbi:MAG: hypothetical protein QM723_28175 [Myxococcaceae bacterium]